MKPFQTSLIAGLAVAVLSAPSAFAKDCNYSKKAKAQTQASQTLDRLQVASETPAPLYSSSTGATVPVALEAAKMEAAKAEMPMMMADKAMESIENLCPEGATAQDDGTCLIN